jgi:hypothetical protein
MIEMLVTSVIVIMLFASVIGAFVMTKGAYRDSIAGSNLQRDAGIALAKMIRGVRESSGNTFGLRSAMEIPAPGLLPAPGQNTISFIGTDSNTRRYFLNNNTIVYDSPTQSPNQRVIYTAPANATITLRFVLASTDQQVAYIYVSISQLIGTRTVTGSVETNVNLRNMPK